MATTYGWVTEAEADAYFASRYGASDFWASGADKDGALETAYNQLNNSGLFTLPDTTVDAMKQAQYEQALFVIIHMEDFDRRGGLQAQGVIEAGIVKEKYNYKPTFPICPMAKQLLESYSDIRALQIPNITRDEER